MSGFPTMGSIVGFAQATGANTLTIPLTDDIAASDSSTTRGLFVLVFSEENDADAPLFSDDLTDGRQRQPTMDDDHHGATISPYLYHSNSRVGDNLPAYPHQEKTGVGGKTYMIRGGFDYVVYNPLVSGSNLYLDYSHVSHTFDWLAASVWQLDNCPRNVGPGPRWALASRTSGDPASYTITSASAWFEGLCQAGFVSGDTSETSNLTGATATTHTTILDHSPVRFGYIWWQANENRNIGPVTLDCTPGSGVDHMIVPGIAYLYPGTPYDPSPIIRL